MDAYGSGDLLCFESSYIYNCIRPSDRKPGYGVFMPETNSSHGPGGWQFASTYWRMLGNGLKAANSFCQGGIGRTGHFAGHGLIAPSGEPRDKMFYAARWASMVHRTERFWRIDPCVGKEKHPAQSAITNGAKGYWTSQARFANSKSVDILFDLKSEYEIIQVKLAKGAKA